MVEDAIKDCSQRKGIVLDPFSGSGTTLVATERTGRRGFAIELDPLYCDVGLRRLHSVCGLQAVLQATGQKLEDVARAAGRAGAELAAHSVPRRNLRPIAGNIDDAPQPRDRDFSKERLSHTPTEPSPICQAQIREQRPRQTNGRDDFSVRPYDFRIQNPIASEVQSDPFGLYVHDLNRASTA